MNSDSKRAAVGAIFLYHLISGNNISAVLPTCDQIFSQVKIVLPFFHSAFKATSRVLHSVICTPKHLHTEAFVQRINRALNWRESGHECFCSWLISTVSKFFWWASVDVYLNAFAIRHKALYSKNKIDSKHGEAGPDNINTAMNN